MLALDEELEGAVPGARSNLGRPRFDNVEARRKQGHNAWVSQTLVEDAQPALVTLDVAIGPYRGLTIRTIRALIAAGRLPAIKVGRNLMVDPRDLASVLRPVVRQPAPGTARRTQNHRRAGT